MRTVTKALAFALGSATLVAVTVKAAKFGKGAAGALYMPVLSIMPIRLALVRCCCKTISAILGWKACCNYPALRRKAWW